jgi:hypothetical protein
MSLWNSENRGGEDEGWLVVVFPAPVGEVWLVGGTKTGVN